MIVKYKEAIVKINHLNHKCGTNKKLKVFKKKLSNPQTQLGKFRAHFHYPNASVDEQLQEGR